MHSPILLSNKFMQRLTLYFLLSVVFLSIEVRAQLSDSPYDWNWKIDGPWLAAGFGGTAGGLLLGKEKKGFTEAELNDLKENDVFVLDRWAAGNYDENADLISEYPFYGSFAVPFALLFDERANDHSAQLLGLYVESLSTTSALFTITAGLTNRARPLVYSEEAPMARRMRKNSKRSFYSGHVAATATALFFAAKVYADFNPDSSLRPYFWTAAFVIPAGVSYFRLKAGKHFLTDIVLGYTLGALTGYLVPELHKRKDRSLSIYPKMDRTPFGEETKSLAISFRF